MLETKSIKRRGAERAGEGEQWFQASQLAAILDNSEDAIITTDVEGTVITWNAAAERIFGWKADEAIGQSILRMIPARHREQERHLLQRMDEGETTASLDTTRLARDGRERPVAIRFSTVRDPEGRAMGIVRMMRDRAGQLQTEANLAAAERKLQQRADDLEERVQARTQTLRQTVSELEAFSYSLSHDMRAPLRAIQNYSQIVLQDCHEAISPTCVAYLNKVAASAERLDRLILDLLNFAKLSQQEMTLKDVDTDRLVRELVQERPEFQMPNADIQITSPLLAVRGNEASLTQCVTNLLANAVKYVARGVRPVVTISSERREGGVRLWFQDNGIGIDTAAQRRLFQMFQRVHGGDYEGTGIGLAIVRKAVERMKGSAGVESEPGHGSRFWLQLPGVS